MSRGNEVGYGLVGAGAFGQYCLQQYRQMSQVQVRAIADMNLDAARQAAAKHQVETAASVDDLFRRDDIDFVHLATPPFTHRDLVLQALDAGKHVLCEKPLAISMADAEVMVARAKERGRVLAVNLIMRYNPLCEAVGRVLQEKLLGEPLHGFFENYAKDEPLGPEHWFWDREKSGGIFIEHGVHFFDLFRWWLGEGEVVAAQQVIRPGASFVEQVQATVQHRSEAGDVLVNHYHGFTQPARMDRQEMRIVCERGSIRLFEWVPTRAEIDCLVPRDHVDRLLAVLPDAAITSHHPLPDDERQVTGRHKPYVADGRYVVTASAGMEKDALYGHVIRSLLADQIAAAQEPAHVRRISEENGLRSLATAVAADRLATESA